MTKQTAEPAGGQQYLTFLLDDEEYAIGILKVREIIEYGTITKVPRTPKWVRGVINLRGGVVPVIDLAVKFGLDARPVKKTTCIIIVETQIDTQLRTMGVVADAVSQVMDLSSDEIREVPEFGTRVCAEYLMGMAQLGKKFALLLDVDKVLSVHELASVSEVTSEPINDKTDTPVSMGDSGTAAEIQPDEEEGEVQRASANTASA